MTLIRHLSRATATCVALTLGCGGAGCAATVTGETATSVDGYDAVYVDDGAVPAQIEAYPRYAYGGGYAYYVNGRYYQRHGNRWTYYRRAPAELERQRVREPRPAPRSPVNAYPAERPAPPPPERERER